jgi:hypothetical protein
MLTKIRRSKSSWCRNGRAVPGTISDPTTLRNPHARPRRGSHRPVIETALCGVVDRCGERLEPRMTILSEDPLGWDNMAKWSILYRCRYRSGHEDRELHELDIVAAGPAGALERLQRRLIGFDVDVLEIFALRPPLSREQVALVQRSNDQLDIERHRLGIYGDGEQRQQAIEQWLRK